MGGLPAAGPGAMQAWPVARTVGRSSATGPALTEALPAEAVLPPAPAGG